MTNTSHSHQTKSDQDKWSLTNTETLAMCHEFATITNTKIELAMTILQQNGWNLDQAINSYFDQPNSSIENLDDRYQTSDSSKMKTQFKLLSWNIDGLDEHALDIRTQRVIEIIKKEKPDVVFLQEVIPATLELIRTCLPEYRSYSGNTVGYFVVILTRQEFFHIHSFEIVRYPGTIMNRNLLLVHTTYKNSMEIDLMTSHQESGTAEYASQQRMEQLKLCFQRMLDAPADRIVLFGGDLNMREKELQKIGDIPSGICDLWIETGKRSECAYTWDMNVNTNNHFPSENVRPRARFDRLYFRPSTKTNLKFQPSYFDLQGLEKIPSIERFCSDHWAIQAYFNL